MSTPQTGIFEETSSHHYYLEYRIADPGGLADSGLAELKRSLAGVLLPSGTTEEGVRQVIAFGPRLWQAMAPAGEVPEDLTAFEAISGWQGHDAAATQRDLFIWLHSPRADLNFERGLDIDRAIGASATLELDLPAFVYRDSRDLTGFVDGSANPKDDARFDAAVIPDGSAGAGGTIAMTQKWIHDLEAFGRLSVHDQERVIGRTKEDSIELEGDEMPPDSHVSRTDVKVDGTALKIYRRSTPFGTVGEHGLYFVAFACERRRIEIPLKRMFGVGDDAVHDKLTAFSKAVTGSYWFAPSVETLSAVLSD